MDRIKEEINASHGVYSLTGRGPSIQMVLWRAGFSKSFLEKKGQDVKRDKIQTERKDRIRRWKRFILSSSQLADTVATLESEVKAAAPETDEYRQSLHDTELELVEAHIEIQELRAEMAKLQSEIKELMAGTNDT